MRSRDGAGACLPRRGRRLCDATGVERACQLDRDPDGHRDQYDHPSVNLTGFRFDGTSQSGNNGFIARMRPRVGGNLSVSASWGAKPFDYSLKLADLTKGSPAGNHPGTGVGVQALLPVTATDLWQVTLANSEDPGLGRISLSATLSWP